MARRLARSIRPARGYPPAPIRALGGSTHLAAASSSCSEILSRFPGTRVMSTPIRMRDNCARLRLSRIRVGDLRHRRLPFGTHLADRAGPLRRASAYLRRLPPAGAMDTLPPPSRPDNRHPWSLKVSRSLVFPGRFGAKTSLRCTPIRSVVFPEFDCISVPWTIAV